MVRPEEEIKLEKIYMLLYSVISQRKWTYYFY